MIDLLSERVGGRVLSCNDEFFAAASNLISAHDPVANDEYTDRGKWMDGWETRRRRDEGHDWCVLALGIPGRLRRVTVDTSHFTGNYPQSFSLEATGVNDPDRAEWVELIPRTPLSGDTVATFDLSDDHRVVLVRLNIFPDGGVARLRVEGDPIPGRDLVCPGGVTDLVSALVGGEVVDASDLHYSHPSNCLRPTESAGMWDGWETKRRRDAGHDWLVARLGMPGAVEKLIVDTTHFKGNAPGWVSLEVSGDGSEWEELVNRAPVGADRVNEIALAGPSAAGWIRLSIHPDGGVARVRVLGRADPAPAASRRLDYVNALLPQAARAFFRTACASSKWVDAMVGARPFGSSEAILDGAEAFFDGLGEADWLEAFAGHPRIGERGDAMANREQAGAVSASRETLYALAAVNRDYEQRFGFTYIVYASGKSADEMLALARDRLGNDRSREIELAGGEQRKITRTRLLGMLCRESR